MSDDGGTLDDVAFLARSETRVAVLEVLLAAGPTTRREFRDRLDASRSTITRALTGLERRGWVTQTGTDYRLTATGEIVAEEFLDLIDAMVTTADLEPFLSWFPYDEYPLSVGQLADADVIESTPGDPYAPGRKQTALLERTDQFRGFLPSVDLEGARVVHEQILGGELTAEIVVSDTVAATIHTVGYNFVRIFGTTGCRNSSGNYSRQYQSGEYATLFREQIETGRLTVYVADGDVPFYLGLGDGVVQIGVEDDEGFPRALLETTTDTIAAWGENVFETHREQSETVTAEAFVVS